MDAAIISLLATLIALMFGGFWLLWRTIHKDNIAIRQTIADQNTDLRKAIADQNTDLRKDMADQNTAIRQTIADQNTDIRKDIAVLRQDHARLEGTLETLLKLIPTANNAGSTDTAP